MRVFGVFKLIVTIWSRWKKGHLRFLNGGLHSMELPTQRYREWSSAEIHSPWLRKHNNVIMKSIAIVIRNFSLALDEVMPLLVPNLLYQISDISVVMTDQASPSCSNRAATPSPRIHRRKGATRNIHHAEEFVSEYWFRLWEAREQIVSYWKGAPEPKVDQWADPTASGCSNLLSYDNRKQPTRPKTCSKFRPDGQLPFIFFVPS